MTGKSRWGYGVLLVLAITVAFGAGYRTRAHAEADANNRWLPPTTLTAKLVRTADGHIISGLASAVNRSYKPDLKPYETLDEVNRAIHENFVRTKIDERELTYGAIRGMLRALGDRFTRFLTPEEYEEFTVKNTGQFTGIGARIDLKDDYVGSSAAKPFNASRPYIVEPIDGGPAAKAGLLKDDVILQINDKSTANMSEDATVSFIRGERGAEVKLKIERRIATTIGPNRDAAFKVFDVSLKRDIIEMHPVKLEWLPERIAWLRLDEFNQKSDAEMQRALQEVQKGADGKGPAEGLIFDMRNNPGGLLDVAVDVGSRFIQTGPIVYTRERNGSERVLNAERDHFMNLKMPVVVLVNRYSASAAEIVTGALKDKGLATVVGETSYGKASVQVLVELKNGGALVITTAKYLTPSKHDISDKGIIPDIAVKATDEDEKIGRGDQLKKAVEVIKQKGTPPVAAAAIAARPT